MYGYGDCNNRLLHTYLSSFVMVERHKGIHAVTSASAVQAKEGVAEARE